MPYKRREDRNSQRRQNYAIKKRKSDALKEASHQLLQREKNREKRERNREIQNNVEHQKRYENLSFSTRSKLFGFLVIN